MKNLKLKIGITNWCKENNMCPWQKRNTVPSAWIWSWLDELIRLLPYQLNYLDDDDDDDDDDDGFFLACENLGGRRFDGSFYAHTFFLLFFKWRSAHAHQFHFLGQDQSVMAQQATAEPCVLTRTSFVASSFAWLHFFLLSIIPAYCVNRHMYKINK